MKQLGTFPEAFSLTIYVQTCILFFSICQYKLLYQYRKSNIYPLLTIFPLPGVIWLQGWKRKRNVSHSKKERNKEQGGSYFVTGPFHMKCWGCVEELWQTGFHSSTEAHRVLPSAKSCQQRWPFNTPQRPRHTGSALHGQGKGKDRGREEGEERELGLYRALLMCSHPQYHKKAFILCLRKN